MPKGDPAGALISSGKTGNITKLFWAKVVEREICPPVTCIPSPGSPANRTTALSSSSRCEKSGVVDLGLEVLDIKL